MGRNFVLGVIFLGRMDILSPIKVINLSRTCKKLYKKNITVQRLVISFATDKKLTTLYNRIA